MMGVLNHLSTLLLLSLLPPALSHVVERFDPECKKFFLKGTTPNLPGILYDGKVQDEGRYKLICQKYKNIYRFATLYDTFNRIPVFSAYTFTGPPTDPRPKQPWMIEPQLENINKEEMKTQCDLNVLNKNVKHQAVYADYINNNMSLDRGHLFPCSYAPGDAAMRSTFTLTNAVPQDHTFNNGSWNRMERNVRKYLEENCKINNKRKAYVVTGAVPNNNKLKNRVNIPELLWTAFCCLDKMTEKWVAQAHWGENVPDTEGKTLKQETLGALEVKLKNIYNDDVKVFHHKCPRNVSVLEDETGRNLETVEQVGKNRGRERSGVGSIKNNGYNKGYNKGYNG
nr:endonuclease domain-containing 1 protein-like [Salvelinus alpinus]